MSTIDPSLLNSIFSVTYKHAADPGSTLSYTKALINLKNINSLAVDSLTYSNIDFGDASGNLFVGDRAGCNAALVSNCTGIGEQSMDYLATGSNVTGLGFSSLRNTAGLTRVVAIGTYAGDSNSNVTDTVIVGDSAARNLSGASSNVIIGSGAGASLTGGSNNILIGAGVNPVVGSNNNVFNIANTLSGTTAGTLYTSGLLRSGGDVQVLANNAFSVYSPGSPDVTRTRLTANTGGRTFLQTLSDIAFTQVGTNVANTVLTLSSGAAGDTLLVGGRLLVSSNVGLYTSTPRTSLDISGQGATVLLGATLSGLSDGLLIQGYSNTGYIRTLSSNSTLYLGVSDINLVQIRPGGLGIGTLPATTLHVSGRALVQTANASSTNIGWSTNGAGTSQTYTMYLIDTDSTGVGTNQRQMMTYVYPSSSVTSSRGPTIVSYRVLLSDQALSGLSAGDLYVDNTLQAAQLLATTVSATNLYGALTLGVQQV